MKCFPEGLTSLLFVVTNLGVINSTVFSSPSLASVTSLALANSGIQRIEPGAFHAFQSLTKLSLYQNSLTNVMASWLPNPGYLENLTVAQNLIPEIGRNMFSGFSNLTTLNLAHNRIRRIASGSFKDLSKLTFVDLSGNNLTTLTRNVFIGLMPSVLKLGNNPWHCSCDMWDFGLFLQELINASLLEDADSVVCRSPASLEGTHVWNISDFNCLPVFPSSAGGSGFRKVGLPVLLACLVFISFILFLLIWALKRDKQVQPDKAATRSTSNVKASSHVDSLADSRHLGEKFQTVEVGVSPHTGLLKVRAKSAAAILLRKEFHPGRQLTHLADANQEHLTTTVSLNNQHYVASEHLCNVTQLWYYQKLEDGKGKDFPSSFLAEVEVETSVTKATSEATKQIIQDHRISEAPKNEHIAHNETENTEPFLYLSVTTTNEELTDAEPKKDMTTKADRSHLVSLKRALTWPYGRSTVDQKSAVLSIRESFLAQFFLPMLGEPRHVSNSEHDEQQLYMRPRKEFRIYDSDGSELNEEGKLTKETDPPDKRESDACQSMSVDKLEFAKQPERQNELQECSRKDDHDNRAELNAEGEATNQAELPFQQELNVEVTPRHSHAPQSRIKAVKCPTGVKKKNVPKSVSSRSGGHHESDPSPLPSDDINPRSPPCGNVFPESSNHNYINLLYEVVENRGRWTRERWKQTHRIGAMNPPLTKSK
ncbi:uncharacterized protein LOC128339045 [Hemicordylus capensis]|uniref:uncharacterized protein LOC128339045 n=1 Tax=Hemicordylus capensis TaxID=884348 RepID=UPI002302A247|nr:uncharacterized protein LOC128339045 [Hemicordylus capensis]